MHRSRRTASPVRVSLTAELGGDIDGAWWPRSNSMAPELPDLIQALHPKLGDILDISINWTVSSATPVLSTMSPEVAARIVGKSPPHRLMFLTGRCALTKLLVVPSMTSSTLALMVLRQVAQRHSPEDACDTAEFQAAQRVICAARAESFSWATARAGQ